MVMEKLTTLMEISIFIYFRYVGDWKNDDKDGKGKMITKGGD